VQIAGIVYKERASIDMGEPIGRVTRCSTQGFVGAVRQLDPQMPTFGTLCKAEAQQGNTYVVGAVYDISIEDDPFARYVASSERANSEQIADHVVNRQTPIEISAIALGYIKGDKYFFSLPPQPPLTMAQIIPLTDAEVIAFTTGFEFIPTLINFHNDELTAAVLRTAAQCRPESEQHNYLQSGGRACARLLNEDFVRLETLIQRIKP
jgi:hypothetical protein